MLTPSREEFHQKAHLFCLLLMAAGLPLSMFIMSISGILMVINWLFWGNPGHRFSVFLQNRGAIVFSSFFLLHIVGLCYTSDFDYAFNDLRVKLPLLFYPVVLSSVPQLSRERWNLLLAVFVSAVFLSTFYGFAIYSGWTAREMTSFRNMSPLISHIRLSLLICLAVVLLFFLLLSQVGTWKKLLAWTGICWLVYFLNLMQSATGIAVLAILAVIYIFNRMRQLKSVLLKLVIASVFLLAPLLYVGYEAWDYFYNRDQPVPGTIAKTTVNGEEYDHNWTQAVTENGHYVFLYIANGELRREWPKRSHFPLDSIDGSGYPLSARVYRYMASKNLSKDSAGVWALSEDDIRAIEKGETNVNYKDRILPIKRRLSNIFLEIDQYRSGVVNGVSTMQRIEYLRAGIQIAGQNFFTGVGTGDVQLAFDKEYERSGSRLLEQFRLRAHNQYLTVFITFGLIGFLIFLAALFIPPATSGAWNNKFFTAFIIVALVSFLSEDTLETQAGVSFFVFFYGMMVWGAAKKNE